MFRLSSRLLGGGTAFLNRADHGGAPRSACSVSNLFASVSNHAGRSFKGICFIAPQFYPSPPIRSVHGFAEAIARRGNRSAAVVWPTFRAPSPDTQVPCGGGSRRWVSRPVEDAFEVASDHWVVAPVGKLSSARPGPAGKIDR